MRSDDTRPALGAALLLVVAVTHLGYGPLSAAYADPAAAARGIFYAARGLESAVLYALVWQALPGRGLAVSIACAWGFAESAQVGLCRAAVGFHRVPLPDAGGGLCGHVLGIPVAGMSILAVLLALCVLQERMAATERAQHHARR